VEKPFEFLEQVEWSANTYGLDLDMVPRTMPELLRGRALKWFIANNKQWAEIIESFHIYFLLRDFFTRLTDQVRQRKQGFSESFKDYIVDMQTMARQHSYSTKETLRIIKENCTPSLRIFLMILADEYEELEKNGKPSHRRISSRRPSRHHQRRSHAEDARRQTTRRHGEMTNGHHHTLLPSGLAGNRRTTRRPMDTNNTLWRPPSNTQRPQDATHITDPQEDCRKCGKNGHWARRCRIQQLLFCWICGKVGVRRVDCCQRSGAAERRAGIAQCYLSKLTGKLIEEEQQLSTALMIGGNSYKATIDTGATKSFISEEMADNIAALGRITRKRRKVRLADGINAQLEVEVKSATNK